MGDSKVSMIDKVTHTKFVGHLMDDIESLDIMLQKKMFEDDIVRIGAEQEFCLITDNWRPASNAEEILAALDDPHFTTEIAKYNLEINLDPVELKGDCFSTVELQLRNLLNKAVDLTEEFDTRVLLTGILPTITRNELVFDYMTPNPRYSALNEMMKRARGSDFELKIRGIDELSIIHDSVLFEACNTSFQLHLQISSDDFISSYNWAQAIAGPVLGISANSPLLLGRELWSETRIALFQQSIDTRSSSYALKDQQARVTFGDSWAYGTAADFFKNEIARYRVLMAKDIEISSLELLEKGEIPKLPALNTHNGSIYRWNRPCYGAGGGKPHLRIENRYIPAGPTVIDEMANFAFWVGLMVGRPSSFDDISTMMDFKDAKSNFIKSARTGKESVMQWNDELMSVRDLITKDLLPIAHAGLEKVGVNNEDRNRLLSVIEERAANRTGAQWTVKKFRILREAKRRDEALLALTQSMYNHQFDGVPVHKWPIDEENHNVHQSAHLIGHIMSTQLFTVNENDLATLALNIMKWKNIRHLPVEDNSGNLCGLLTMNHIERFSQEKMLDKSTRVCDIMTKHILTTHPDTPIKEAIYTMKKREIGCLPVEHNNHLVGIVTIPDLIEFDND